MENPLMITLIIGFIGLALTIISAVWLSSYQFRDSLRQIEKRIEDGDKSLLNQMSEMSKRFEANLSEVRTELKSAIEVLEARIRMLEERMESNKVELKAEIRTLQERMEMIKTSLEERMEANKVELKAEILAVKSDLSFNYNEKLGAVENRIIKLEQNILPRIERLEREAV